MAWSSSCSRNAHAQKVLVRRAHSRIDQATPERDMKWGKARSEGEGMGPDDLLCSRNARSKTPLVGRAQ